MKARDLIALEIIARAPFVGLVYKVVTTNP
ncbi:hypothetical protein J3D48_002673 [Pseudomonas fluorescens]|nr:hypothetical protein [Pseudomonas fluorescens]